MTVGQDAGSSRHPPQGSAGGGESPAARDLPHLKNWAGRTGRLSSHPSRSPGPTTSDCSRSRNPRRAFYEAESLRGGWTVRQLDRQIGTQFYERTLLSRN
jgi:hypothetical protein